MARGGETADAQEPGAARNGGPSSSNGPHGVGKGRRINGLAVSTGPLPVVIWVTGDRLHRQGGWLTGSPGTLRSMARADPVAGAALWPAPTYGLRRSLAGPDPWQAHDAGPLAGADPFVAGADICRAPVHAKSGARPGAGAIDGSAAAMDRWQPWIGAGHGVAPAMARRQPRRGAIHGAAPVIVPAPVIVSAPTTDRREPRHRCQPLIGAYYGSAPMLGSAPAMGRQPWIVLADRLTGAAAPARCLASWLTGNVPLRPPGLNPDCITH